MQFINVLAIIVANCTPDNGMGCFPCCGVTSTSSTISQSGNAGLGAAVVGVVILIIIARRNRRN